MGEDGGHKRCLTNVSQDFGRGGVDVQRLQDGIDRIIG
jgi:hypothetical protein